MRHYVEQWIIAMLSMISLSSLIAGSVKNSRKPRECKTMTWTMSLILCLRCSKWNLTGRGKSDDADCVNDIAFVSTLQQRGSTLSY